MLNAVRTSALVQDAEGCTATTSPILEVTRRDLSQLVSVRQAHQTNRAAKSVKTHSDPQVLAPKSTDQTDRQRLCAQIGEVLRRTGTGLERDVRWRCQAAPGTRGPHETLLLTGNSANAEVVAKERVNTVCNSCSPSESPLSHKLLTGSGDSSTTLQQGKHKFITVPR